MLTQSFYPMTTDREAYKLETVPAVKTPLFRADERLVGLQIPSSVLVPRLLVVEDTAGEEALVREVLRFQPEIVVLDITKPGSISFLARAIREASPRTRIVCLTMHASQGHCDEAFRAGVSGYVSKRSGSNELISALRMVQAGGTYLSPHLHADIATPNCQHLSARQRSVLRLIAEGQTAKQVAFHLGISQRTAEFHKNSIMNKLNIRSTAQLTRYAVANGIVT
jgi:two-component system, NarL family, nitrate/nitrite response regulator NarL